MTMTNEWPIKTNYELLNGECKKNKSTQRVYKYLWKGLTCPLALSLSLFLSLSFSLSLSLSFSPPLSSCTILFPFPYKKLSGLIPSCYELTMPHPFLSSSRYSNLSGIAVTKTLRWYVRRSMKTRHRRQTASRFLVKKQLFINQYKKK